MSPTDLVDEFTRQAGDAPSGEAVRAEVSRRFAEHARIRARRSLIAVAAVVVLVAGGAAALAMILPKDSPSTAARPTPQELVPVLATEQRDVDELPDDGTITMEHLDPDSVRLIGDSEHGKAWAALDSEGNICLVLLLPNGVGGAGCPSPADFERSGARIEVSGGEPGEPHRSVLAILLPSDVPESSVTDGIRQLRDRGKDTSGWIESFRRESTPLLLMDSRVAIGIGELALTRSDGAELILAFR